MHQKHLCIIIGVKKHFCILLITLTCSLTFAQLDSLKTIPATGKFQKDSIVKTDRVEVINKSFDKLVTKLIKKNDGGFLDRVFPIFTLIIGALITYFSQYFLEIRRTKKEKEKRKQLIISKGRAKVYQIEGTLRELAMLKVHKQYYFRFSVLFKDDNSYKKHYDKGQEHRIALPKLENYIAEYIELVAEYNFLTSNSNDFKQDLDKIYDYELPKSFIFLEICKKNDLQNALKEEENRLKNKYSKEFVSLFKDIQTGMEKKSNNIILDKLKTFL